jgi:type IV pilus assembly protein PilA
MLVAIFGGGGVLLVLVAGIWALTNARHYLVDAKVVEARTNLKLLAKQAVVAAEKRGGKFCLSATKPVPADVSQISGKQYASTPAEWQADAAKDAGFACVGFEMTTPQRFQYDYRAGSDAPPGAEFVVIAHGDLNGDGKLSTFRLTGRTVGGQPTYEPYIEETDTTE